MVNHSNRTHMTCLRHEAKYVGAGQQRVSRGGAHVQGEGQGRHEGRGLGERVRCRLMPVIHLPSSPSLRQHQKQPFVPHQGMGGHTRQSGTEASPAPSQLHAVWLESQTNSTKLIVNSPITCRIKREEVFEQRGVHGAGGGQAPHLQGAAAGQGAGPTAGAHLHLERPPPRRLPGSHPPAPLVILHLEFFFKPCTDIHDCGSSLVAYRRLETCISETYQIWQH